MGRQRAGNAPRRALASRPHGKSRRERKALFDASVPLSQAKAGTRRPQQHARGPAAAGAANAWTPTAAKTPRQPASPPAPPPTQPQPSAAADGAARPAGPNAKTSELLRSLLEVSRAPGGATAAAAAAAAAAKAGSSVASPSSSASAALQRPQVAQTATAAAAAAAAALGNSNRAGSADAAQPASSDAMSDNSFASIMALVKQLRQSHEKAVEDTRAAAALEARSKLEQEKRLRQQQQAEATSNLLRQFQGTRSVVARRRIFPLYRPTDGTMTGGAASEEAGLSPSRLSRWPQIGGVQRPQMEEIGGRFGVVIDEGARKELSSIESLTQALATAFIGDSASLGSNANTNAAQSEREGVEGGEEEAIVGEDAAAGVEELAANDGSSSSAAAAAAAAAAVAAVERRTEALRSLETALSNAGEDLVSSPESSDMRDSLKAVLENLLRTGELPEAYEDILSSQRSELQEGNVEAGVAIEPKITLRDAAKLLGFSVEEAMEMARRTLNREFVRGSEMVTHEEFDLIIADHTQLQRGFSVPRLLDKSRDLVVQPPPTNLADLPARPPVVAVMGHVDHGKTTLLDTLRGTRVAAGEAGGITQSVSAFRVVESHRQSGGAESNGSAAAKSITFIDTPGHSTFKVMRSLVATLTDIVVLVVAADDGVMPQTLEVIDLAMELEIPLVVAINKIDRPTADVARVRRQLMQRGVVLEGDPGGDVLYAEISALKGDGLQQLKEAVLLTAEMMELRTNTDGITEALVLERVLSAEGPMLNVIVSRGRLRIGDWIVCGKQCGRIRGLLSDRREPLRELMPGEPGYVLGLSAIEGTDTTVFVVPSEEKALDVVDYRTRLPPSELNEYEQRQEAMLAARMRAIRRHAVKAKRNWKQERKEVRRKIRAGLLPLPVAESAPDPSKYPGMVPVIVKADNQGSLDVMITYISKMPMQPEAHLRVTLAGVGDVTFDDVRVASISRAPIFAFNVTVKSAVEMRARAENVQIFSQNVIYRFFDDALSFLVSRLPKNEVVEVLATADVKQIFMLNGRRRNDAQLICAGCSVSDGELLLKGDFRVVREGKVMLPKVRIRSLRHLKEEVSRVAKGKDCGIVLEDQIDLGIGDKIQLVARKYVPRQLDDSEARGYASRDDVY